MFVRVRRSRTVTYSRRHESHAVRPADRFHINNRTLLSDDDAAPRHQVAHRGVRGRHPRPPIRSIARGREPPRRLGRSARPARVACVEDAKRFRRDLGLARRLAGSLRRRRLVGARTLARRGQLAKHTLGRYPTIRVEDDAFGLQQRALAPDGRCRCAPLAAEAAQTSVRRDDSLSGHTRLGGAILAHNRSNRPRAAAGYCSHGSIRRDLAPRYAAHDRVHLGLECSRHSSQVLRVDDAMLHGFERMQYCRCTQPVLGERWWLPLHRHTLHSTTQMLHGFERCCMPLCHAVLGRGRRTELGNRDTSSKRFLSRNRF